MHVLIQNPINHTAHENKTQHLQNIYSGTYIYIINMRRNTITKMCTRSWKQLRHVWAYTHSYHSCIQCI